MAAVDARRRFIPLTATSSFASVQESGIGSSSRMDKFDRLLQEIDPGAAYRNSQLLEQQISHDSSLSKGMTNSDDNSCEPPKPKSQFKQEEELFYNAEENDQGTDDLWGLLSSAGGNIYEWYDFAVYGLLASEIGSNFFPNSSERMQLIASFEVYFAAFLMRPVGAIVFGELADRYMGRKNALVLSIVLITLPSILMGLLPGYQTLGTWAPILLVILRMMQGLSVGGQLAGSYVLSIEQSTSRNRGIRGAICDASSVGGFLCATLVTTVTRCVLREEIMEDWGWRVPFWISAMIAPFLFKVVHNTEESKHWEERTVNKETENLIRESENKSDTPAVVDLFNSPFRVRQLTGMVFLLSSMLASFKMLFLWVPLYLSSLRGIITETKAGVINILCVIFYIIVLIAAGSLSDKFEHRMDLIRIALPGVIVGAPVMFGLFESESEWGIILAQFQFCLCVALLQGGMAAYEVELWMADPSLSFTGVAIGHNLASLIFSGTLPLVATGLVYRGEDMINNSHKSEDPLLPRLLPGFYISFLGLLGLWAINFFIRHPHDIKTGEKIIRQNRKERLRRIRRLAIDFSSSFIESAGSFMDAGAQSRRGIITYKPPIPKMPVQAEESAFVSRETSKESILNDAAERHIVSA